MERLRQTLAALEVELLSALNFEVDVELPYKYLDLFRQSYSGELTVVQREALLRVASNFVNDSFLTTACLYKSAEQIASACLSLAVSYMGFVDRAAPKADSETLEMIRGIYTYGNVCNE
jgi:hypothetical protein